MGRLTATHTQHSHITTMASGGSEKPKREVPDGLVKVLEWDRIVTKKAFDAFDKAFGLDKHRANLKFLEYSCHGIPWLGGTIAMLYLGSSNLELWMNLLLMLFVDIVCVAFVKAFTRRRRPAYNRNDMVATVGVDKFSFPSGHASRAAALTFFFTLLYPLHFALQLPVIAWGGAVMVSRVLLGRHHILDVAGGLLVAFVEYVIMSLLWMDKESADGWALYFGAEDPWSSA